MMITIYTLCATCAALTFVVVYTTINSARSRQAQVREFERRLKLERARFHEERERYEERICRLKAGIHDADPLPLGVKIQNGQLRAQRRWLSLEDEAMLEEAAKEMN